MGCIFAFLRTFKGLVERFNPDKVYVCWDKRLCWPSSNFRHQLTDQQYKINRVKPDNIQEMYDQEAKLVKVLGTLGVRNFFPYVMEADDVVAWLARRVEGPTVIVSVDSDLLQLINAHTSIFNLKEVIDVNNFEEKIGIDVEHFKLYKAIMGDTSDNLPGLPGHGKVRAKKLAVKWDTATVTDDYKKIVEQNLKLIDLDYGYTVHPEEEISYKQQFEEQEKITGDLSAFRAYCEQYHFTGFLNAFNEWKRLFNRNHLVDMINALAKP